MSGLMAVKKTYEAEVMGIRFRLNRPIKWTIWNILQVLDSIGYFSVTTSLTLTRHSSLRDIIKAARHIEDKANENWSKYR